MIGLASAAGEPGASREGPRAGSGAEGPARETRLDERDAHRVVGRMREEQNRERSEFADPKGRRRAKHGIQRAVPRYCKARIRCPAAEGRLISASWHSETGELLSRGFSRAIRRVGEKSSAQKTILFTWFRPRQRFGMVRMRFL